MRILTTAVAALLLMAGTASASDICSIAHNDGQGALTVLKGQLAGVDKTSEPDEYVCTDYTADQVWLSFSGNPNSNRFAFGGNTVQGGGVFWICGTEKYGPPYRFREYHWVDAYDCSSYGEE